jgi:RNA polymerase sigma factor (sigma-70 family)
MPATRINPLLEHLRRTVLRDGAGLTDGQLLDRFITDGDTAAFEALVRRHGPMVLGVCRRILRDPHDADDAFQATFLVLTRKACSVWPREMVGNWLYGVAHTTALRVKAGNAKRRMRERQVMHMPEPMAAPENPWDDLQPLLDQELARLPDKYRAAIVLCDLEERSRREAARQLKIPEGTVSSRLTTGRRMLAKRLTRRGLVLSGASLAVVLSESALSACVPISLVISTVKAATCGVAGTAAAACPISIQVAVLAEGVQRTMLLTKLKIAAAVLLVAALLGLSVGIGVYGVQAADQSATPKEAVAQGGASKVEAASSKKEGVVENHFRQYRIQCMLVKVDPKGEDFGKDGKGKVLGEPEVVAREETEASFLSGGEVVVPAGKDGAIEMVNFGFSFRVKVFGLKDGRIRLHAVLEKTDLDRADKEGFQVHSKSIRSVATLKLGEAIKLVEKDDQGYAQHWARIKVVTEETITSHTRSAGTGATLKKMEQYYRRTGHPGAAEFYRRAALKEVGR